jgi:membrane protease YdiL (CAAX protease family)
MLLINFIILSIGLGIVTPNLSVNTGTFVIIYPWPNFLFKINLSGGALIAWYLFLVVAIIISIVWLIKTEGREFLDIFVKSAKKLHPPPLKFKNSFVMIFQFFFALMFFNVIIIIIVALWGFPGSNPVGEEPALWRLLFDLANASVAEEIFTRTVYIGIPLLIFDFILRRPKNKLHRYFVGGGFKIEHITIFLIIFSSVIFGLAHYPGWGLWKVFPTTAAGLAFGYLFVRKGIHAAIILHFLFDYMAILPFFFLDNMVALGLLSIIFGIMTLFWSTSGLIYFSLIFMKISEFINIKLLGAKPQPQPAGAPTAPYGGADYYGSTQYPYYPPLNPEAAPESVERNCSVCKNKLRYLPYASSYYCDHCMRYEY